jgi:hypothetical protein
VKTRMAICVAIGLAYGAYRLSPVIVPVKPAPAQTAVFEDVARIASKMSKADRAAVREAYQILSRAIAADPAADPVFADTEAIRRAHRAALLVVWRGVLENQAGEVPGLREALEGAVTKRLGTDDIPLNPSLRAEAAKAFSDIAASIL